MDPWEALTPVLDLPKEEQPEKPIEVNVSVEPTRYKGDPVVLFLGQQLNALSDKAADISLFNAVHVDVIVTGTTPSATISLEGSSAAGGTYIPLPDSNASRIGITTSISFDCLVGSAFVKARITSISGTFGVGQGFTVVITPYVGTVAPIISTPTTYNQTLTLANTEYSQALPNNCKRFEFQCRTANDCRFAFVTGKVATPTAPYHTLKAGDYYESGPINQGGLPSTLYLASATAGVIVEILVWT